VNAGWRNIKTALLQTRDIHMSVAEILLPLFVQVGLTFVLMFWMASLRVGAIRRGDVKMREIALRQPWPERAQQISNAFHNQLELPLLFYVIVILALITRTADFTFVLLSWAFVVLRIVHASIHVTSNNVQRRFYAFAASAIVLAFMWLVFFLRIVWVY
jgi:hypothetical protein